MLRECSKFQEPPQSSPSNCGAGETVAKSVCFQWPAWSNRSRAVILVGSKAEKSRKAV